MSNTVIMTHTGRLVDTLNPDPANVCLEDIAHALSQVCRYTGHTARFFSVAEHCLHASRLGFGDPLACLLHDAAEAYLGDVASPFKRSLSVYGGKGQESESFAEVEAYHLSVIGRALGVRNLVIRCDSAEVKLADKIMLCAEAQLLLPVEKCPEVWEPYFEGLKDQRHRIAATKRQIWSYGVGLADFGRGSGPEYIKRGFIERFKELTHG